MQRLLQQTWQHNLFQAIAAIMTENFLSTNSQEPDKLKAKILFEM